MVASATPRGKRSQRQRNISVLSFTQRDESGRFIAQSIHSTADLFKSERPGLDRNNPLDVSNRSNIPFNKTIEEVYDGVHDGPVLGYGVSGYVRKITNKETGEEFAVKRLNLSVVRTDEDRLQLVEEIDIMCQLDHPNIVRLEEIYESDSIIYLVIELCHGGELFDQLDKQEDYHYPEEKAADLVKQVLSAVSYLHSQGIVHRDLKLENFLFETKDPKSSLKMIDFGLSKHFKFDDKHKERVGTPYTVAPEVIRGSYDEKCDVWGIGVICYLLLCGDSPFGGCDASGIERPLTEIRRNILSGKFHFKPDFIWDEVSQDAKDFITTLLTTDPANRPNSRQVRNLPFLRKHDKVNKKEEVSEEDGEECWLNLENTPCFQHPLLAPFFAKMVKMKKDMFEAS